MKFRVFVIDDDRDHAESIADVLEMRGYEVEIAFTGEDGVARFRDVDFDIVFMDVKLPGMNGVETFFEFKKIRPNAKVMMMTGYSVEQLIAQAVENGAMGVLRKPFSITDVIETLAKVKPRGMVLVADDNPDFVDSIEPILAARGYRVEIARTGPEALTLAGSKEITCLVLDLKMPVLSGIEVYLKLKELGQLVPTIFVTGYPDEKQGVLDQIKPSQTEGILVKPFDPAELLRAVDAATSEGLVRSA
jgi:two-component system, NtrC family, response regulator HydG